MSVDAAKANRYVGGQLRTPLLLLFLFRKLGPELSLFLDQGIQDAKHRTRSGRARA